VKSSRIIAATLLILAPAIRTWADEAPPPPQDVWIGKGQFGFLNSHGNSDAESINGNIDLLRYDGAWKNELYLAGLYGKSSDIVSAERWETHSQSNYNFSADMFAFGGLRYEHDLFDGFQYQWSATTGIGYKIFTTDANKLTVQAGVGYRRLRPEIIEKDPSGEVTSRTPLDATGNAIGTAGVDYTHAFNKTTTFTNKFLVESGSDNNLFTDALALTVKMSEKLALSAAARTQGGFYGNVRRHFRRGSRCRDGHRGQRPH
jgi:putative salt-induced outer membrane protein YdiY